MLYNLIFYLKTYIAGLESNENLLIYLYSNTLVSTKIYKIRKTSEANLNLNITSIQKEIIIGTLLGDSSIERAKPNHNSRIRFDQSFPEHAPYIMYLFGVFNNLCKKEPKIFIRKPDIRTGKVYSHISYISLSLPCLNEYYDLFSRGSVRKQKKDYTFKYS